MYKENWNDKNNYSISILGEIYNLRELGFDNYTSPEDAISKLYKNGGLQEFSRLDGRYVVIIRDFNQTHVIRDHHGIGLPIYYNEKTFSSSLHEVNNSSYNTTQPNYSALCEFLSNGYIHTPSSSLSGINKLGAGEVLTYREGVLTRKELFPNTPHLTQEGNNILGMEANTFRKLHSRSIASRINGKKSVGILLSGGYDSGANLVSLRDQYEGPINSYTIGFKGDSWSEAPLARIMSEKFGTTHHEYEIDGSEILELPSIIKAIGDPFVEGGILVNYSAMKLIASSSKPEIILGGDASDQYFGTSGREVAIHYLLSAFYLMPLVKSTFRLTNNERAEQNQILFRLRFHLDKIINILDGDQFGFSESDIKQLVQKQLFNLPKNIIRPNIQSFNTLYEQHTIVSDIDKIVNHVILHKASRMADLFDVNIAFPFADLSLFNYLRTLPTYLKSNTASTFSAARGKITSKYLLKHVYRPLLPEEITSKRKQGGFAPMPIFFSNKQQRARIAEFIMNSSICKDFLNREAVSQFISLYDKESNENNKWFWYRQHKALQYYKLLSLAIWWEITINKNDSITL